MFNSSEIKCKQLYVSLQSPSLQGGSKASIAAGTSGLVSHIRGGHIAVRPMNFNNSFYDYF